MFLQGSFAKETYNLKEPWKVKRSDISREKCPFLEWYGVASSSRLLKIIGLFCKRVLYKRRYSAKETCNFKEPTHRSHPISLKKTTFLVLSSSIIIIMHHSNVVSLKNINTSFIYPFFEIQHVTFPEMRHMTFTATRHIS